METIVYIEMSGIGNMVLSTPMLQAIKAKKPKCRLIVISWDRSIGILKNCDFVDKLISINQPNAMEEISSINNIDYLVVSPVGSLNQVVEFLIPKSKELLNVNMPAPWTEHEADRKMVLARKIGYRGSAPPAYINIGGSYVYDAGKLILSKLPLRKAFPKIIAICAGYLKEEHWPLKHWGNENYSKLITEVYNKYPNHVIALLGSEQDKNDAKNIIDNCKIPKQDIINLCGISNDILITAGILFLSRMSIGNDGGLQHIASAVGIPTVTVFTFTNPIKNRPFNQHSQIALKPCEKRLMCQHNKWQRCKENGCLDVELSKVMSLIDPFLKSK